MRQVSHLFSHTWLVREKKEKHQRRNCILFHVDHLRIKFIFLNFKQRRWVHITYGDLCVGTWWSFCYNWGRIQRRFNWTDLEKEKREKTDEKAKHILLVKSNCASHGISWKSLAQWLDGFYKDFWALQRRGLNSSVKCFDTFSFFFSPCDGISSRDDLVFDFYCALLLHNSTVFLSLLFIHKQLYFQSLFCLL